MISNEEVATIKGMLARGDKQQWIAAWFGGEINAGRIAEINTSQRSPDVAAAALDKLPPVGPYISGRAAHRALVALLPVKAAIDRAVAALTVMEKE